MPACGAALEIELWNDMKAPTGNAVKDSCTAKDGVSLKSEIMKKARLPHVACGPRMIQPGRESGDVTEDDAEKDQR